MSVRAASGSARLAATPALLCAALLVAWFGAHQLAEALIIHPVVGESRAHAILREHAARPVALLGLAAIVIAWLHLSGRLRAFVGRSATRGAALAATALTAGLAGAISLFVFWIMADRTYDLAFANRREIRDTLRTRVAKEIAEIERRARMFAASADLEQLAERLPGSDFLAIRAQDRAGRRLLEAGVWSEPELFARLREPKGAVLGWRNGAFNLLLALPLRDGGIRIGEVLVQAPMGGTNALLEGFGETGETILCGGDGAENLTCFPSRLSPGRVRVSRAIAGWRLPASFALDGEEGAAFGRDHRGRLVVAAYGPVGNTGLGLVAKMDYAEIHGRLCRDFALAGISIFGIVAAGVIVLYRRARPLAAAAEDSRNALDAVIAGSRDGIIVTDSQGLILHFSPAAERIFGWRLIEVAFRSIDLIFPGDPEVAGRRRRLARGQTGGNAFADLEPREATGRRKDGALVSLELTTAEFRESGQTRVVFAIREIGERNGPQRVEAIDRRQAELAQIVARSPVVAVRVRHEAGWPVEYVSDSVSQFGYASTDLLAGRLRGEHIIPAEEFARVEAAARRGIARGMTDFRLRFRLRTADGAIRWVEGRGEVRRAADGRVARFEGVLLDVTAQRERGVRLARARASLACVLENATEGIAVCGVDGRLRLNRAAQNLLGLPPMAVAPEAWAEQYGLYASDRPALLPVERVPLYRAYCGETVLGQEIVVVPPNGPARRVLCSGGPITMASGEFAGAVVFMRDVTPIRQLEEERARAIAILESAPDFIGIADDQGRLTFLNAAGRRLVGLASDDDLSGYRIIDFHPESSAALVAGTGMPAARARGTWQGETVLRARDGREFRAWQVIMAHRAGNGAPSAYSMIIRDVTAVREAEERLAWLARHDPLTGLPNRLQVRDRLQQALAEARPLDRRLAVLVIDLDRFKLVNDSLGYEAGDELLEVVAGRIRETAGDGEAVGRFAGDEFVLVLADVASMEEVPCMAERILAALQTEIVIDGREIFMTASIGVAVYPEDGASADELLRRADAAMYRAKEAGGSGFQFCTPELETSARRRLALEAGLHHALSRDELVLHYQPKVSLETGAVTGLEALMRWHHPVRGLVSPVEFIPALEETGLIVAAGKWAIRRVVAQLATWRAAGLAVPPVAINLSARQFLQNDPVMDLLACLAEGEVDPAMLEFEITESVFAEDPDRVAKTLARLRELGIRIALDDFGTGYSSLGRLKSLPLDALKIDRSFVRDLPCDEDDAAICRATFALARGLGLRVVAEGVETLAQASFLAAHGCDEMQGYLFSAPLPPEAIAGLLREGRRLSWKAPERQEA